MSVLEISAYPDHPGFESDARVIADNVLLAAMPAASGQDLSEACNRALALLPDRKFPLPWIEAVDLTDGSVTLRVS